MILADEPTGSLATEQGMRLLNTFTIVSGRRDCVVIASHDDRISKFADRVHHSGWNTDLEFYRQVYLYKEDSADCTVFYH